MKKNLLFLLFTLLFLTSCNEANFNIIKDDIRYDDVSSLYLPTPILNNSVFLGYEVLDNKVSEVAVYKKNYEYNGMELIDGENIIYPELNYDILKNHSNNNEIKLRAVYDDLSIDEMFKFELVGTGYYAVSKQILNKYPREITIPDTYKGVNVQEVMNFGFYGIKELIFVNFPKNINYLGKQSFASTNIYKHEYSGDADESAFSNTLVTGQGYKECKFNLIEGNYKKVVKVNDLEFNIDIDLNGGKIIEEELELVLPRPILENEIFESFENEEGYIMNISENELYKVFTLKDYYRYLNGFNYKINSRKVTDDIYNFRYIDETDSYALYLFNDNLAISKLVLPDTYNGKKITEVKDITNKFVSEIIFGKHVEEISGLFCTPNLKSITLSNGLKKVNPYAFSGTALTSISLPSSLEEITAGVFAYTFIKNFSIPDTLKYIDGSAFARCTDIKYTSNNLNFIVSTDQRKVYYKDQNSLLLYSYKNEAEIIDLYEIEEIGKGTFSYALIKDIVNTNDLKYIHDYAFYKARIDNRFNYEKIDYVSKTAFLGVNSK